MKKTAFNASSLRIFLVTLFAVLVVASVGGFYFAQDWLNSQALLIDKKEDMEDASVKTADSTQLTPQQTQASVKSLEVFQKPDYQTKVRQDLDTYAKAVNLTVASVEPIETPKNSPVAPTAGVTQQTLRISLKEPVKSSSLVTFIKAIESNLPVMRLTSLKITNGGSTDKTVRVDELTIQVYIRG